MSEMTLDRCGGCENNFYNGNNPYGVKRCWSFDAAKVEKFLLIQVDQAPPYDRESLKDIPTCYKRKRFVKVKLEALDSRGYWRA